MVGRYHLPVSRRKLFQVIIMSQKINLDLKNILQQLDTLY